jgi:hypothetical protein
MKPQKKSKKNILTWRNKHIARDISRSCEIPYEDAVKLLQVIINIFQVELKSKKYFHVRGFGTFRYSKWIRPSNRAAYRLILFKAALPLSRYLGNHQARDDYYYELLLARKAKRLLLAGDKKQFRMIRDRLNLRLEMKPECTKYMLNRKIWPLDI